MEKITRECSGKTSQGVPKIPKFLSILYQILEERKHSEFIGWSPDGKIVVINKPVEFAEELLPVYFKHSNYSSFVRQLNLYNFRKKKHYPMENAFAHAMFLKGRKDLLQYVKRKTSNMSPEDKISMQFDPYVNNDSEYDEMVGQNRSLKRVQEEMSQKIQSLEQTVKSLTNENETLQHQCKKKKQNEHFLKKVVNHIAKIHGRHQISELIESIAYESLENKLNLKSAPEKFLPSRIRDAPLPYEKQNPFILSNDLMLEIHSQEFSEKTGIDCTTLQTPYLQTFASFSTMPDAHDPFNFHCDFDDIIDPNPRPQSNPFEQAINSKYELDDFLCFDEGPAMITGQF